MLKKKQWNTSCPNHGKKIRISTTIFSAGKHSQKHKKENMYSCCIKKK